MQLQEFESLSESEKRVLIFDAEKVDERMDNKFNYQLFNVHSFFVEVATSLTLNSKGHIRTFSFNELPKEYKNANSYVGSALQSMTGNQRTFA